MAQINLLKQNSPSKNIADAVPGILVKLLIVILVGLLGYYAWLFYKTKAVGKNIVSLQESIAKEKKEIADQKDREELLTRQQQLQQLDSLITSHPYWSEVLPALAKVTLKSASYSNITATQEGYLIMSVKLPTLIDLDKFLQVFDLPEFSSNFSDVSIGAYHKVADGDKTSIVFEMKLKYNPKLLQYKINTGSL